MGYREDQTLPSQQQASEREGSPPPGYAPPLPPRDTIHLRPQSSASETSSYSEHTKPGPYLWTKNDPRATSTDSLLPQQASGSRRTLLLIYIHGFLGDETTFRSFPAHLHGLVTHLVSDSHVVHTKIYPKYKSRRAIDFARDDFSNWLAVPKIVGFVHDLTSS